MVPCQLLIGGVLLYLAPRIEGLFAAKDVTSLTVAFFILYFLCATQDIAVDGWALTMLREENAGYASTCNAVGQTLGFTLGIMVPMTHLFALPSLLIFWGTLFVGTTLAVTVLKQEAKTDEDAELEGILEAYHTMFSVMRKRPVQLLALHLFTRSIAFVPADIMAVGRLQDLGFPKETIAGIKLVVTPIELLLPWVLAPFTAGPRPLTIMLLAFLPRVLLTPAAALFAHHVGVIPPETPVSVSAMVLCFIVLQGAFSNSMFVAHMGFFAKVSDPAIGGTYMTLLNTIHNLGNMWAATVCMKVADPIKVHTGLDGFYVLCGACGVYGVVWFLLFCPMLRRLQERPSSDWSVKEG